MSSPSQLEPLVFFTDANLGRRIVPDAFRTAGEKVIFHDEIFKPGTSDQEWLQEAGRQGWIVLTKDSKIRYRSNETSALLEAKVRAFVLVTKNLPGPEMAEIFVKALPAMKKLCLKQPPPFIAHVHRGGDVRLMKTNRPKAEKCFGRDFRKKSGLTGF
ncbi:MAG: hypothetical protein ACOYMS_06265 [Terrimicrobiaceae bacterium]